MKTEPGSMLPPDIAGGSVQSQVRSHRWLADLERAWLDAFPRHEAATQDHSAGLQQGPTASPEDLGAPGAVPERGTDAAPRAASVARLAVEQHCSAGRSSSSARQSVLAVERTRDFHAGRDLGGAATNEDLCMQVEAAHGSSRESEMGRAFSMTRFATAFATHPSLDGMPEGLVSAPSERALRAALRAPSATAGTDDSEMPASNRHACTAEPRSFARRLMQVAGDEELQLNLRDAAVQGAQQEAVASALFRELHGAGMALRRLYLNGQRYEHGQLPAAPSPIRNSTDKE